MSAKTSAGKTTSPREGGATRAVAWVASLGVGWFLLDQLTKYLVVARLTRLFPEGAPLGRRLSLFYGTDGLMLLARRPVQIVPGLWEHLYVENPAGAFGLLSGVPAGLRRAFFIAVALLAALVLLYLAYRSATEPPTPRWRSRALRLALALVFGGALGNLTDRAVHGYVIDFIHWHYRSFSWPPFNLADVGIVCGVIALVLLYNTGRQQDAKAGATPTGPGKTPPKAKRTTEKRTPR